MKLGMRLPDEPSAVAEARRALDTIAPELSRDKLDDVRLLVTELVTNSARHAGGWIDLNVDTSRGIVRVEVRDKGPGFDELHIDAPDLDSIGGRGLYLV